jgi:Mg-chelatase subunit ChlD
MNLPNRRVFPTKRELYTRPVVVMVDTSGSQLNDEDMQKAVDTIYSILIKHRGQQVYVGHWADGMTPATIRKPIILEGGRSSKEHIKRALQSVQSGGKHLSSSLHHLRQAINNGRVVVNNERLSAPRWGELRDRRPSALLVITDGHIDPADADAVASDRNLMRRDFHKDAPLPPMFVLYTHDTPNTLREHLNAIPHFRRRHAYVGDRGDTE